MYENQDNKKGQAGQRERGKQEMREEDEKDEQTESEKEEVKADLGLMDDCVFREISDVQAKVPTYTSRLFDKWIQNLAFDPRKTESKDLKR